MQYVREIAHLEGLDVDPFKKNGKTFAFGSFFFFVNLKL